MRISLLFLLLLFGLPPFLISTLFFSLFLFVSLFCSSRDLYTPGQKVGCHHQTHKTYADAHTFWRSWFALFDFRLSWSATSFDLFLTGRHSARRPSSLCSVSVPRPDLLLRLSADGIVSINRVFVLSLSPSVSFSSSLCLYVCVCVSTCVCVCVCGRVRACVCLCLWDRVHCHCGCGGVGLTPSNTRTVLPIYRPINAS